MQQTFIEIATAVGKTNWDEYEHEGNTRSRTTVTSSLNEISRDLLGIWKYSAAGRGRGRDDVTLPVPIPFYSRTRARICGPFMEPRNRFPSWRAGSTTLFFVPARQAT